MLPINLVAFDTETNGTDPSTAEIVQLGAVSMCPLSHDLNIIYNQQSFPTSGQIPEGASEVHGVFIKDLLSSPSDHLSVQAFCALLEDMGKEETVVLVSYNGESYDVPLTNRYRSIAHLSHIDVFKIVQRTPDLFQHGLKLGLVYQGYLGKPLDGAHDAIIDVVATLEILSKYMKETSRSVTDLLEWLEEPQVLEVCFFGKHAGKHFSTLPKSYLKWVSENWETLAPDMAKTLEYYK